MCWVPCEKIWDEIDHEGQVVIVHRIIQELHAHQNYINTLVHSVSVLVWDLARLFLKVQRFLYRTQ